MRLQQRLMWVVLCVLIGLSSIVSAQVVEMPDPNLRAAVREELGLAQGVPLTRAEMERLTDFGAARRGIVNLTGLEHAVNLRALTLWGNPISDISPLAPLTQLVYLDLTSCDVSDISPLASLTRLEILGMNWNKLVADITPLASLTRMRHLKMSHNLIVDVNPLASLTDLEVLWLDDNQIEDISPLANLTRLAELRLNRNQIVNVTPLAGLHRLKHLEIERNRIVDHSPLEGLVLTHLTFDAVCISPRQSITTRLANRTFPSVFAAWGYISNRPELSDEEQISLHDLWWSPSFNLRWRFTARGVQLMGDMNFAQAEHDRFLALNPNLLFIRQIPLRSARVGAAGFYPEDFPFWVRDESGNKAPIDDGSYLLDFTDPGMQGLIVEQIVATAECGLYDGVFFDYWNEYQRILVNGDGGSRVFHRGYEAEQMAKENIVRRAREAIGSDFLILGNANRATIPRTAEWMNGTFMETGRDHNEGYTPKGLMQIESTLLWAEESFMYPRVMCLEGYNVADEPPDTPTAKRWMRLFTTMSLTCSDGLVLFRTHNGMGGGHHWYEFYDTDLGRPIGTKAQQYQDIDGLFIREFTNGWAVYNRSGKNQAITLPRTSMGVSSNRQDITHLLTDLDGEIYLRKGKPFDLNRDGTVNVLDLILVSQHFDTTDGDINGDGTTNMLDLTLVAQQFSQ